MIPITHTQHPNTPILPKGTTRPAPFVILAKVKMPMKFYSVLLVVALGAFLNTMIHAQTQTTKQHWSSNGHSGKYSFSLVTENGKGMNSWGDMNGADLQKLREHTKEDTLFVKKDGQIYSITDRDSISQTKAAMEPMEKLGKEMGALGKEQGAIGKEQGALGKKQGELGRQMGELGRQMGEANRKGESTKEISAKMDALGEQMKALGKEMSAMGEKHRPLGAKMGELGKQMGEASREANAKIEKIIDSAFARGLAHKV